MATSIYPEYNKLTTHMGGEGAPWIGQAAFSEVPHVFQNLGDGTYFHSGYLAIRARWRPRSTSPTRSCTTTPSP
jgi:indolepyruvate ferredoxin oxidoreductase